MPIEDATATALQEAKTVYEQGSNGIPAGFVKLQGIDGRTKEARYFKEHDKFSVSSSNSTHVAAPNGSTVTVHPINGGQSLERKKRAYKKFLDVMQRHGFLEDASVYTRMD